MEFGSDGPPCPSKEVIPEARLRRAIRDPDEDNPVTVWSLVFITCLLPAACCQLNTSFAPLHQAKELVQIV